MSEEEKKAIEILKDNIGILEGKLTIKYTNYNTVKAYNTILNLIDKQQKEIEELKKENIELSSQITDGFWENDRLKNEIEELKEDNSHQWEERCRLAIETDRLNEEKEQYKAMGTNAFVNTFVGSNYISKDKIKEKLGIEEDMTEEQILSYIDILVSENNRLEDIEDRKVQVAVDNIEKKRDKYWQEKIKNKMKELEEMELTKGDIFSSMRDYAILILYELWGE